MRRLLWLPAALVLAWALLFASCGGGKDEPGPNDGPVRIELWHSMSATLVAALQRMIDEFNASQTQYQVEAVFQGSYTDSLNKLISSMGAGNIPAIIQLDDVSTQIMIDSGAVVPMQEFIDAEGYDLSDFEPKGLAYYTQDGVLYSMPFNVAGPILYYDRFAFQEAGLDPDRPPATLDEVRQYSEQLLVRNDQGEITRSGIALQISGQIFEQMLAKQGALYANNGNGREGRATEVAFDSDAGKQIIEWWDEMVDSGLAMSTGRSGLDAMLAVASGRAAMAIESTAALSAVVALIAVAGEDPARLGTGPLPAPAGEAGGIALGGASLWILKERPEEEQQGAWAFMKFAMSPEQQAQWHADTGYFTSRISAYDLPPAVQRRQQFPQFETAVKQLHDSPVNDATRGALLGPFNEVRDILTRAFEQVLSGGVDPASELEQAADEANNAIKEYNRTAP
jgi:sn-glycerol 3-phosphate transport system substrate-binding protein